MGLLDDWFNRDHDDGGDNFDFELNQDIKTDIKWEVNWDFDKDVEKDFDIDADVKVDVDGNGSDLELVLKDLSAYDGGVAGVFDTQAIEDAFSSASLQVQTDNVAIAADSLASDSLMAGLDTSSWSKMDSDTWTEIDIGVDYSKGDFAIVTVNMEAFVDG